MMDGSGGKRGRRPGPAATDGDSGSAGRPSDVQRRWLLRGVGQPGGKLPLFDPSGREIPKATIRACIEAGWAEPWFANPVKPDWLVCKLTDEGYRAVGRKPRAG